MSRIAIIGGGAWGTALAMVAGRRGDHEVRLWALEKEVVSSIIRSRVNEVFLPGCPLPESVTATSDFREALEGAEIVVSVMPSHHCRRSFEHMAQWLRPEMLFLSATKGIENETFLRMTEVIQEVVTRYSHFTPKSRGAQWTFLRTGSCGSQAHGCDSRFKRTGPCGAGAEGIQ